MTENADAAVRPAVPRPAAASRLLNRLANRLAGSSQQIFLAAVLVALCVALSFAHESFLTVANIKNVVEANSYRLILALGMTLVVCSGVMDLSAGSAISLCGVVMAVALHASMPVWAAVLAGVLTGVALGAVNGALIHFTRINFFILTLATSGIYRGVSLMVTDGKPITGLGSDFMMLGIGRVGGVQVPVIIVAACLLVCVPLLFRTKWGSYILSLGGNADALRKAGVRCGFYRIGVHMAMVVGVALTALVITARLNSAEPNAGMNMELDAITAVIMGGTLISGGAGSILGTVLSVLILGVIRNGLTLMSVPSDYQQWITGVLLLASVLLARVRIKSASNGARLTRQAKQVEQAKQESQAMQSKGSAAR